MITGDSQAVADSVARRLGIDEVAAQVLPADKAAAVERFQEGGRKVAMVGDGVNDAPALATADVGHRHRGRAPTSPSSRPASCSSGATRATSSAAIELSRATYRKMIQNLVWATGYNLVAIPVAPGVLVPLGDRPADGRRRDRDERLDDHRGRQRPAAARASPAPRAG